MCSLAYVAADMTYMRLIGLAHVAARSSAMRSGVQNTQQIFPRAPLFHNTRHLYSDVHAFAYNWCVREGVSVVAHARAA